MNMSIPLAILTSTLVDLSITWAILTCAVGSIKILNRLVLDLAPMNISIPLATLTSTLVNLSITLTVRTWAAGKPEKENCLIWLDAACLGTTARHIQEQLMHLPFWIFSSREMLVLAGPSFSSRLWCLFELFVFLQLKEDAALTILVSDGTQVKTSEQEFSLGGSITKAVCSVIQDQEHILAVIEDVHGTITHFDALLQKLCRKKVATARE